MSKHILLVIVLAMLFSCSSGYTSKRGKKFIDQLAPVTLSDVQAGDILFVLGDGVASDAIKVGQKLTDSQHYYFSHVAMAVSDTTLIHSTYSKGVSTEKIRRYLRKNRNNQVVVVRNKNANIAQGAAEFAQIIMSINKRNNNFSYSIEKAIESLNTGESNEYLQDEIDFDSMLRGDNQDVFCSKLIAYIYSFTYKQNKLNLNIPNYNAMTPSNLADLLLESETNDDFYAVGRIE